MKVIRALWGDFLKHHKEDIENSTRLDETVYVWGKEISPKCSNYFHIIVFGFTCLNLYLGFKYSNSRFISLLDNVLFL